MDQRDAFTEVGMRPRDASVIVRNEDMAVEYMQ